MSQGACGRAIRDSLRIILSDNDLREQDNLNQLAVEKENGAITAVESLSHSSSVFVPGSLGKFIGASFPLVAAVNKTNKVDVLSPES